jgi:hypothetical protein
VLIAYLPQPTTQGKPTNLGLISKIIALDYRIFLFRHSVLLYLNLVRLISSSDLERHPFLRKKTNEMHAIYKHGKLYSLCAVNTINPELGLWQNRCNIIFIEVSGSVSSSKLGSFFITLIQYNTVVQL